MTVTVYEEVMIGGGDFQVPDVEAGTYEATIIAVDEGQFPSFEDRDILVTKLMIDWELDGVMDGDKSVSLRQFVTIPPGLARGKLHEKATLHAVLQALRRLPEPGAKIRLDPTEWIGERALVLVNRAPGENPKIAGTNPPLRKAQANENGQQPTDAQQALLTALTEKFGGLSGQKMLFLEERDCEGKDVLAIVLGLDDNKARGLANELRKGGA